MSADRGDEVFLSHGSFPIPAAATWWSSVFGQVGVTNGQTTVTGVGTNFNNRKAGQTVSFANQPGTVYTIASITSSSVLELTSAFTGATNAATAMGFAANPIFNCDGESRLKGWVNSSVAPTTIQIQLSQDAVLFDKIIPLTLDAGSSGVYSFDINLVGAPFFRLVFTAAGATTAYVLLYTSDFGSGPNVVGGTPAPPTPPVITPIAGFETLTLLAGAAASTSLVVPAGAIYAYMTVEGDSVRWRDDGTDPTAAVGMLMSATTEPWFYAGDLDKIEFICAGLGGSTVSVSYYR